VDQVLGQSLVKQIFRERLILGVLHQTLITVEQLVVSHSVPPPSPGVSKQASGAVHQLAEMRLSSKYMSKSGLHNMAFGLWFTVLIQTGRIKTARVRKSKEGHELKEKLDELTKQLVGEEFEEEKVKAKVAELLQSKQ